VQAPFLENPFVQRQLYNPRSQELGQRSCTKQLFKTFLDRLQQREKALLKIQANLHQIPNDAERKKFPFSAISFPTKKQT
jgi:hypothetical protein